MNRSLTVFLAALVLPAAMTFAAEQKFEVHATAQTLAAAVDFKKQLNVASPSLNDLGVRIDAARAASDPIGLAAIASELGALEKSTGKTADIKSDALAAEAIKLAQERNQSAEIKAVAVGDFTLTLWP